MGLPAKRMRKFLSCKQSWKWKSNFRPALWKALGSAEKSSRLSVWGLLTCCSFFFPSGLNLSCSLFSSLLCALFSPSWDISMSVWIRRTWKKRKKREKLQAAEETWLVSLLRKQNSNTGILFFFNSVDGRLNEGWAQRYFIALQSLLLKM